MDEQASKQKGQGNDFNFKHSMTAVKEAIKSTAGTMRTMYF